MSLDYRTRREVREFIRANTAGPLTAQQVIVHFRLRPDGEPDVRTLMAEILTAQEVFTQVCTYPGNQPGQEFCGAAAAFSVLRRGFDPVHPDPDRDNLDRCREHLAATVEDVDRSAEPGYVVHVTVIASVLARQERTTP